MSGGIPSFWDLTLHWDLLMTNLVLDRRFVDDALGFALTWNYWFNDAVSTASDIIALQLLLEFWTDNFPGWAISLIFLVVVIALNILSVRVYGEVRSAFFTILTMFTDLMTLGGILAEFTQSDHYCGTSNIILPFVSRHANPLYRSSLSWALLSTVVATRTTNISAARTGISEMPRSLVALVDSLLSLSQPHSHSTFMPHCVSSTVQSRLTIFSGGTESIAITAGETKDPAKNLPKVVRNVFWRILLFYLLSILIVGLNVPYNYPGLSDGDTRTSPFTIVFQQAGSTVAGSFINAVIMTSVISAANHALFAGSRLLYSLAVDGYAPRFFGHLNRFHVPWVAVLATSVISGLCFGASYIGAGKLWTWLQNIVGVSNQLSWICIGLASLRFRSAIRAQGLEHLLPFKNWTYPYGPIFAVGLNIVLVLVQGWKCFSPHFKGVDFVSYYIEIAVMIVMFLAWKLVKRTRFVRKSEMDLRTDRYDGGVDDGHYREEIAVVETRKGFIGKVQRFGQWLFF